MRKKTETKPPREKKLLTFTQSLPVALTERELLDHGQRLARCQSELADHLVHADEVKKQLKAEESKIENERSRLSRVIRDKAEPRDVQVVRWARYDEGMVVEIRTDTQEVVHQRAMEPAERQVSLPMKVAEECRAPSPDGLTPNGNEPCAEQAGHVGLHRNVTGKVSWDSGLFPRAPVPDEPPRQPEAT